MAVWLRSKELICENQNCAEWAKKYLSYCLCNAKDGVSFTLGIISVTSWAVAEVPQIITNYKEKSTEGLSLAFLTTWIIGDLFNVFGCILEPATLPTQYYTAMLYTMTTTILFSQTIYYGHIYPRLKRNGCHQESEEPRKSRRVRSDTAATDFDNTNKCISGSRNNGTENGLSSPIPLPAFSPTGSPGRELYYTSARSLSSSHTPTAGSFLAQKMTPTANEIDEPLLGGTVSRQSRPTKNMLCVVSVLMFIGTLNLHCSKHWLTVAQENESRALVMRIGRKILQLLIVAMIPHWVTNWIIDDQIYKGFNILCITVMPIFFCWVSKGMQGGHIDGGGRIGNLLGWAMAAIYMGGRLPQICLNIRRGNVEGLSPFMFVFALVGNSTYVASILVSSLDWFKIRPNLPWLVDSGGCVLLDTFILIQFLYFRYRSLKVERKQQQVVSR